MKFGISLIHVQTRSAITNGHNPHQVVALEFDKYGKNFMTRTSPVVQPVEMVLD